MGRSGTEAGGADHTFHPPAEVKDKQELHCFHHIRNQKEPKSRRIKSHWRLEALLWLSRDEGYTCCRKGMFSAYLCSHARPPVTPENRPTWGCCTVNILKFTIRVWNSPEKGAWMTPGDTQWSGGGWIRTPAEFDAAAQVSVSARRTPLLLGTALLENWPSFSILGIHSVKVVKVKISLLSPSLTAQLGADWDKTVTAVNYGAIRGHAQAFHTLRQHVAIVNSQWPRVKTIVFPSW